MLTCVPYISIRKYNVTIHLYIRDLDPLFDPYSPLEIEKVSQMVTYKFFLKNFIHSVFTGPNKMR